MEKTIAILGSTGSIGTQTLEVVRENQDIRVAGLSAGSNITLLEKQIREFHPSLAAVWDEEQAKILAGKVRDLDVKVVSGMGGLLQLAQMEESQILVTAIVGMIGIRPTIAAIQAGKDIALANKETLVTAGHLIMPMAKEKGVQILPVDSEHSAIFQAIHGEDKREIHKLLITASGRTIPWNESIRSCTCKSGRRTETSELGDGTEDHDRLGNACQQRSGSDGGKVAL